MLFVISLILDNYSKYDTSYSSIYVEDYFERQQKYFERVCNKQIVILTTRMFGFIIEKNIPSTQLNH